MTTNLHNTTPFKTCQKQNLRQAALHCSWTAGGDIVVCEASTRAGYLNKLSFHPVYEAPVSYTGARPNCRRRHRQTDTSCHLIYTASHVSYHCHHHHHQHQQQRPSRGARSICLLTPIRSFHGHGLEATVLALFFVCRWSFTLGVVNSKLRRLKDARIYFHFIYSL